MVKKYKIKDRKRMKQEDLENLMLMEEVLGGIPKPRCGSYGHTNTRQKTMHSHGAVNWNSK